MSRAAVPAAASTVAPSKIPALRTTSALPASFAARNTINMDDLLDQVIHSIVTEEASRPPATVVGNRNTIKVSF